MPNHIINHVSLRGSEAKINEAIKTMGNKMDFEKVLPMPKELEGTTSPSETPNKELIKKFGADNWYDWHRQNWGTKWNAYGLGEIDNHLEDHTYTFFTAWSTPQKALVKLSEKFPNVIFDVEFADEDMGYNCGAYSLRAGVIISHYYPDYDLEFACDMWDEDINDYE